MHSIPYCHRVQRGDRHSRRSAPIGRLDRLVEAQAARTFAASDAAPNAVQTRVEPSIQRASAAATRHVHAFARHLFVVQQQRLRER